VTTQPDRAAAAAAGGRREQKKSETRRALVDAAIRRFLDRGYEATTLEEIAAAANVSMRTLLRYFDSKEQLFHAWHHIALDRFRGELADRPPDLTVLAFWRAWVAKYAAISAASPDMLQHRSVQSSIPALNAHWLAILQEYEELLAQALLEEVADPTDARLAAVAMVAGNEAVTRAWVAGGASSDVVRDSLRTIDRIAVLFGPVGVSVQRT
jgi:AcrR family transcriptional regulator